MITERNEKNHHKYQMTSKSLYYELPQLGFLRKYSMILCLNTLAVLTSISEDFKLFQCFIIEHVKKWCRAFVLAFGTINLKLLPLVLVYLLIRNKSSNLRSIKEFLILNRVKS